jgi:hypothetical protein
VLDPIGTPEGPLPLRAQTPVELETADHTEPAPVASVPHFSVSDYSPQQYEDLLSGIGVLEALLAELPNQRPGIGHNRPPIGDDDVQEIRQAVAILKSQPALDKARAAGSTLKMIGERLGSYLLKQADIFISEAVKSAGKEAGKRVVQLPFWWALATTLLMLGHSVEVWLR